MNTIQVSIAQAVTQQNDLLSKVRTGHVLAVKMEDGTEALAWVEQIKMYERDFKAYLSYAGTFERATQSSTLEEWRDHLSSGTKDSPNTINRMMSAVKSLMVEAEAQGLLSVGAGEKFRLIRGVRVESFKYRQKRWSRMEISPTDMRILCSLPDLLTVIGVRDSAILHTLASSGLRTSELSELKVSQIVKAGQDYQIVMEGNDEREYRSAPLSLDAYEAIQSWLKLRPIECEYLFTGFDGKGRHAKKTPLTHVSVWRIIREYACQCGLEHIKPHDLRRFVATQLAKKNPRSAQKILGGSKVATTFDHYVMEAQS